MGRILDIRLHLLCLPLLCGLCPALAAFAGPSPFPERPVLIFVIAGQSNALGLAPVSELEDQGPFIRDDILTWRGLGGFQTLEPGQGHSSTSFGPELTLGVTLADAFPDRQVVLLKHAPAGSGLTDWSAGGFALEGFETKVENVVDSLTTFGIEFDFGGTFWVQGERDAADAQAAADYELNLLDLIRATRSLTGADPFAIAGLSTNLETDVRVFADLVRGAQANVSGADPLVSLVNTDDIPLGTGQVHYTGDGYLMLGERLAQAHLELVSVVPELSAFAYLLFALAGLVAFSRRAPVDRRRS